MKKHWKSLIVLLLIIMLVSQLDLASYFQNIKRLDRNIWIKLIFMQFISLGLILVQWVRIGRALGKKVSYRQMFYLTMKGNLYDSITPGAKVGGELAKVMVLKNEMGFKAGEASGLVAIQKSISMLTFLILNIISLMMLSLKVDIGRNLQSVIYLGSLFLVLILMIFVFLPEKLYKVIQDRNLFPKFKDKILGFLGNYKDSIHLIKSSKKELYVQLILSLCIWTFYPVKLYYIIRSLNMEVSFFVIFSITFISYIVGMVPLLPGGLGGFEGTMVGLFLLVGINQQYGLVIAVIFRFVTFWLLTLISMVYLFIRKVFLYGQIRFGV